MPIMSSLIIVETHPIQYHAPLYRAVKEKYNIPIRVIYRSDYSIRGYRDEEFGETFAWDTDLISGYESEVLSHDSEASVKSWGLAYWSGLRQLLIRIKPKAIFISGYSVGFYRLVWLLAWQQGIPLIFRGETTDHAKSRSGIKSLCRDAGLRLFYAKCAKLLYIGKRSHAHYQRLGCQGSKLMFSPYCVDVSCFELDAAKGKALRLETRSSLNISDKQVVLLFSGKLSHRKGPDLILNAVKRMNVAEREGVTIIYLGSGAVEAELKKEVAREPKVDARFVGFKNQSALSAYYHASDLLILPSRSGETWGLVVNEALHHGVPCIVSDAVGCAVDLVVPSVTGELFETDSAESLVLAIKRGIYLSGKRETSHLCKKKAAEYSIERAADGIAKAYFDVTNDKK